MKANLFRVSYFCHVPEGSISRKSVRSRCVYGGVCTGAIRRFCASPAFVDYFGDLVPSFVIVVRFGRKGVIFSDSRAPDRADRWISADSIQKSARGCA